jgi:RNA polymerase sigma factor (sigma-70 family)
VLAHDDAPNDPREFLLWCHRIARNLALHHWRAVRRHNDVFVDRDWDEDTESADVVIASFEETVADRESLLRCVEDLDEPSRRLLELKYVDGKTSREIARIVHQSPEAVRMKIMRVRAGMRHRLSKSPAPAPAPETATDQNLHDSGAY